MAGYIALVHKDEGTSYGVSFPDVPGCISAGDTLEEALANAAEALGGHLALMRADGEEEPVPRALGAIRGDTRLSDELSDALVCVIAPASRLPQVASAAIRGFSYDETLRELRVRFRGGAEYTYLDVPPEEHAELTASQSKGRYVSERIVARYAFRDAVPVRRPSRAHGDRPAQSKRIRRSA